MRKLIDADGLDELVAKWKPRLGLSAWDIRVVVAETDADTSTAECHRSEHYDRATIVVAPWVLTGELPEQVLTKREFDLYEVELSVLHELLHCATRDLMMASGLLAGFAPTQVQDAHEAVEDRAEERLVDGLARALLAWDMNRPEHVRY